MDTETLKQYLADNPPTIVPLAIKPHFEALSEKEKLYAHHISV
jgi:dipeptidyl-peptidase-3